MSTAPMIKVAKRMCDWTSEAITTFLPITGTWMSPIGIEAFLLAGEVHDAAERQHHVQDDHDHEQDKDRGDHHGPERYQGVAGEEHEHLLVEEEEPLGARHVGYGGRVRRLGQGRRGGVREHHAGDEDRGRDVAVFENLPGEERDGLVRALVDVLRGDYLFLNRFGLASRRSVHLYTSLLAACPHDTSSASLPSVNILTPRPDQLYPGGPRRAPPRPRLSRSRRTPRRAGARAASPAYPCTRTRCRRRRGG